MDWWQSVDGLVAVSRWTGGSQWMDWWQSVDGLVAVSGWTNATMGIHETDSGETGSQG